MPRALLVLVTLGLLLFAGTFALLVETPEPLPARVILGLHETPREGVAASFLGAPVVHVEPVLRFVVVETTTPGALLDAARHDPRVRYAEPDREAWLSALPLDPLLGGQYGVMDVRAPEAWDLADGAGERTLCVIDSGIRWTHEDLRGPRYLGGWDFVAADDEPHDQTGHGTHVLGIAAASRDNARGIAGLADASFWVARTAANNSSPTSLLASAMRWCIDVGGDVINLSLGSASGYALADAVQHAHAAGALLVAAAGNRVNPCSDCIDYPAAFPEVVAVTCTGPPASAAPGEPSHCPFSREGEQAEIAAPGERILSTMTFADDRYYIERGTSMSTPHVSGAALLVWNARPGLPASLVREILVSTARDLGPRGHDHAFGHGLLDARAAVELVTPAALPVCLFESPLHGEARGTRVVVWTDAPRVTLLADGAPVPLAREDAHRHVATLPAPPQALAATCEGAGGARHAHR